LSSSCAGCRQPIDPIDLGFDGILFSEALAAEGEVVFAKACELGLEGIVSKRPGSFCPATPSPCPRSAIAIEIVCQRCGRHGRYNVQRHIETD
jgi:hypothetical protein